MLVRGEVHLRALYVLLWTFSMEILCKALQVFVAKSSCQFAIAHEVCIYYVQISKLPITKLTLLFLTRVEPATCRSRLLMTFMFDFI